MLASIGRSSAVVDFGWLRLKGLPAWILWSTAHIFFLIGWRNRVAVFVDWMWSWMTYKRGARVITDREPQPPGAVRAAPDRAVRAERSEEGRGGKECVSTGRSRWALEVSKKK